MSIRKTILSTLIVVLVLLVIAPISIRAFSIPWESSINVQPNKTLHYSNLFDEKLHHVNPLVLENAGRLAEGDLWDEYKLGGEEDKARIRQYKIEVSSDGETFTTAVDKTKNDQDNAVEFNEIKPIKCRHVRLTITGWPKGLPCGVVEFTVFGKSTPK
jgi:hypothetical protein